MSTVVDHGTIDLSVLEQFAGKWVAVRDGAVVASADTLEELRENADVRREDAVYIVPERPSYFF